MSGFLKKTDIFECQDDTARAVTDQITITQAVDLDAIETKVDGSEANATADQTGTEIVSAVDTELGQTDWKVAGVTQAQLNSTSIVNAIIFG